MATSHEVILQTISKPTVVLLVDISLLLVISNNRHKKIEFHETRINEFINNLF